MTPIKRTALCVDDEEDVHSHITPLLESIGFNVVGAYDGVEAINLLQEADYDIAV